jgi:hypothetical protein
MLLSEIFKNDPIDPDPVLENAVLRTDVPSDEWLAGKRQYAQKKGRNRHGAPYMGTPTAFVRGRLEVPVELLAKLPGMSGEQQNVRKDSLRWLMQYMKTNGHLPTYGDPGAEHEYEPFINVAYNGEAWVNEGNHRIMAAAALGWRTLPIEIRYFDGGERVEDGPMYPGKIGLGEPDKLDELSFLGSPCTQDCSGHRAGYEWYKRKRRRPYSWSNSFNNGAALAQAGK